MTKEGDNTVIGRPTKHGTRMTKRHSVRVPPSLEGLSGVHITEAAEFAGAIGWTPDTNPVESFNDLIPYITTLEVEAEGDWYPAWVAPDTDNNFVLSVFCGQVEDEERQLIGTIEELSGRLRISKLS